MEKEQRPEGILERAAEALDLPGDGVAGLRGWRSRGSNSSGWKTIRASWRTARRRSG